MRLSIVVTIYVAALLMVSCSRSEPGSPPAVPTTAPSTQAAGATKVRLALNWKPEPEFGGFWAAQGSGIYARHNLEVAFTAGPGAPVVQMVEAGQADFGIASADEVVIARSRGADIVAVFATYQTCPQGLMVHAARGFKSIEDIFKNSGTLAVEPGLAYVKFLKQKYGTDNLKVVPYNYSNALFMQDPRFAQQCFVTAEPITAKRDGADPRVFLIADAGYNPYTAVVITRGAYLREQRAVVDALTAALRAGWREYLDNPGPANAVMAKLNTAMDRATFDAGAVAQQSLIEDEFTRANGLGAMSAERWQQLIDQLLSLKVIDVAVKAEECFVNP